MPKIIKKLNKDHIEDLQVMSENSPFDSSFWQIVDNSVNTDTPLYNLYECECGGTFILKKSEFERLKKTKASKCFHDVLLKYSASIQDAVVASKVKQASKFLKANKMNEAVKSCLGLLPFDSFESFDYGL